MLGGTWTARLQPVTLTEPLEWNNSTIIKGGVAQEVSRLKQQPGYLLVDGSAQLANMLRPSRL